MNENKRRVELIKLGYLKVDGLVTTWINDKNNKSYSEAEVDEILKKAGKWQDDFDMYKLL